MMHRCTSHLYTGTLEKNMVARHFFALYVCLLCHSQKCDVNFRGRIRERKKGEFRLRV